MTREDLLRLIARAVRRSFTFASETQALGAADTVLRDLKAVGIRMLAPGRARSPELRQRLEGGREDAGQKDQRDGAPGSGKE